MIVYEAEGDFKLLSKMAVSSVKGVKREQKGRKKEAKRCWGSGMLESGGGRGGPMLR